MNRNGLFIVFFFTWSTMWIHAQAIHIEGKVLDATTEAPVAYAIVYNRTLKVGSITNTEGYFKIQANSITDSIQVIFIGYPSYTIPLQKGIFFYNITMEESPQLLKEIVVTTRTNAYLYELVSRCARPSSTFQGETRAYYDLKTYADNSQLELIEGYYNARINGYDLQTLNLKAGRLALQPLDDRLFASMESSVAVTAMPLLQGTNIFPTNPLQLSKKEMRKRFDLFPEKKYLNESGDSIFIIRYMPTDTSGHFFSGTLWINKPKGRILKMTLECANAQQHPFMPIFPGDQIDKVDFLITRTFAVHKNQVLPQHIDFTYTIDYKSRPGEPYERKYTVSTQAFIYFYGVLHPFDLPQPSLAGTKYNDYRRINAMPYNTFFWNYHTEYGLNTQRGQNEKFYREDAFITGETMFENNPAFKKGLFEFPYVTWSENRIRFKPTPADTLPEPEEHTLMADRYHLEVIPFFDINTYHDSTDLLTAVIMDPYESFYRMESNSRTQCFINLYFDLCEAERRDFVASAKDLMTNRQQLMSHYEAYVSKMHRRQQQLIHDVDLGRNEQEMKKWNEEIRQRLGIDNMAIFNPFESGEKPD